MIDTVLPCQFKMISSDLTNMSCLSLFLPARTPSITNDLISLDSSANVMKILSENGATNHPLEVLGSKQSASLPVSVAPSSDTYATLTSVVADTYDKQELNIIFDSLLQKWPETSAFPDPHPEVSRT